MNLTEFLEKWGRTLFEAPLGGPREGEPPELAEIRLALFEQVRERSYRAGGRRVFPYGVVRLFLLGVERSRAAALEGRFFRQYLEAELRTALRKSDCRHPENLRVEVETTPALPGPGGQWLRVEILAAADAAASPPPARLVVLAGEANVASLPIDRDNVYIGRAEEVWGEEGIRRRNDLVFAADNEINRTVSREHAHIVFDRSANEYRLHNDRWRPLGRSSLDNPGVWILRRGVSLGAPRGARGVRLEHGDEIRFGRAAVRFELG